MSDECSHVCAYCGRPVLHYSTKAQLEECRKIQLGRKEEKECQKYNPAARERSVRLLSKFETIQERLKNERQERNDDH